jgi:uncharacterized protein
MLGEFFSVSCSGGGWLQMSLWLSIVLIVVALIGGIAIGFFAARQYMMKYLKENPPINEQMIRVMMAQMGRKPSEKQVRQMMSQMNKFQDK